MQIGIGLPNAVPGAPGAGLVEWARRAEERGFSGLATLDRIAYPSHDSLATFAAAAAVTTRIGLMTNILLAPIYPAPALAKAAVTIDQISGGRFTLGLAPGSRADDYELSRRDFHTRGAAFDQALDVLRRTWRGEPLAEGSHPASQTPTNDNRVPLMIGGGSDRSVRRAVEWGDGWTSGGAPPQMAAPIAAKVREAWQQAGREGEPRLAALAYFSLGAEAEQGSHDYLRHYYGYLGEFAEQIASSALRSEDAIRNAVTAFADAGFTELYFDPTVASPDQIDRLADLVL